MKDDYDFSNAERGRFFRPGVEIRLPVYLEGEVAESLLRRAESEGVELGRLVNDLLRRHVGLIEPSRRPRCSGDVDPGE